MVKTKVNSTKSKLKPTTTTAIAGTAGATLGRSRKGRDSITRVENPVKVVDTHARQWNRYSP